MQMLGRSPRVSLWDEIGKVLTCMMLCLVYESALDIEHRSKLLKGATVVVA